MRKFILVLLLVVGLASLSFAAVEVKSGTTVVGKTETLAITGPTIAVSGTDVTVNTLTETGNKDVSGTLTAGTADAFVVAVDGSIYSAGTYGKTKGAGSARIVCISVDGTIYGSGSGCY